MKFRSIQLCERKSAVFKAIQFKLADMATQRDAAELALLRAAWMEDNHKNVDCRGGFSPASVVFAPLDRKAVKRMLASPAAETIRNIPKRLKNP